MILSNSYFFFAKLGLWGTSSCDEHAAANKPFARASRRHHMAASLACMSAVAAASSFKPGACGVGFCLLVAVVVLVYD